MPITCQECKYDNPDNAHYCGNCGAPLERRYNGAKKWYTVVPDHDVTQWRAQLKKQHDEIKQLREELVEYETTCLPGILLSCWKEKDYVGAIFMVLAALFLFAIVAAILYAIIFK